MLKSMSNTLDSARNRRDFNRKLEVTKVNSSKTDFLIPKAQIGFIQLRKVFTKALILHHLDPERHIQNDTDVFGYAIGGVLSQMTSNQQSSHYVTTDQISPWFKNNQKYPITFFFRKILSAKTQYKTHNQELLAIVEAFKTWCII